MIKAIAKFFGPATSGQIDVLAGQVAELSKDSVCGLICSEVETMSFSEARGYVRARAARIVRKQACAVINRQPGAEQEWVDLVARTATERLVPLVLRKAAVGVPRMPVAQMPAVRMAA